MLRRREEAKLERDIRNHFGGPEYPDVLLCPNEVGKGYTGDLARALQAALPPATWTAVQAIMQRHRQSVAEVLEEARAMQRIRPDLDSRAAASLFLGAIQGLVVQSMLGEAPVEVDEQAAGVLRLYLAGLGARS